MADPMEPAAGWLPALTAMLSRLATLENRFARRWRRRNSTPWPSSRPGPATKSTTRWPSSPAGPSCSCASETDPERRRGLAHDQRPGDAGLRNDRRHAALCPAAEAGHPERRTFRLAGPADRRNGSCGPRAGNHAVPRRHAPAFGSRRRSGAPHGRPESPVSELAGGPRPRRAHHPFAAPARPLLPASSSATTGRAFRPRSGSTSSSRTIRPGRQAAAWGWASPSAGGSSASTAARSQWKVRRATGPRSPSLCPPSHMTADAAGRIARGRRGSRQNGPTRTGSPGRYRQ